MPIELGLWRIDGGKLQKLPMSQLDKEATLEDVLAEDLSLVSPDLMLLGRQVATAAGITNYMANGGKLDAAQEQAGHADPRTTGLYDRHTDKMTKAEIERMRFERES